MTSHFARKYQRIRDGPLKSPRKVDKRMELLNFSGEVYQLLPPTPPGGSGVPLGAFLGASWVTSKPSKLVRSLRDSSENIRRPLRDSSENIRTLVMLFPYEIQLL